MSPKLMVKPFLGLGSYDTYLSLVIKASVMKRIQNSSLLLMLAQLLNIPAMLFILMTSR